MAQIINTIKTHWYIIPLVIACAWIFIKQAKTKPLSKELNAEEILDNEGINDNLQKNYYTNMASELSVALGTAYSKFDPRNWNEDDERVYTLMEGLTVSEFKIISKLYHDTFAKGRSLSDDLAKFLDDKYYKLLRVK